MAAPREARVAAARARVGPRPSPSPLRMAPRVPRRRGAARARGRVGGGRAPRAGPRVVLPRQVRVARLAPDLIGVQCWALWPRRTSRTSPPSRTPPASGAGTAAGPPSLSRVARGCVLAAALTPSVGRVAVQEATRAGRGRGPAKTTAMPPRPSSSPPLANTTRRDLAHRRGLHTDRCWLHGDSGPHRRETLLPPSRVWRVQRSAGR